MEWSKIKTIILMMLVGVNLFLLVLVGLRAGQGARYEDETLQAAIQVLEQGGIAFEPAQVPEDIALPVLTVTRDRASEADMARALLGEVTQTGESEVRPGYTGPGGTAEFSMNGGFTITFAPGRLPRQPGQSLESASRDCLRQMELEGVLDQSLTQGGDSVLTYVQKWEDAPVFSCRVSLTWSDEALLRIEGTRLAGTAERESAQPLLSTPTVLMRFLASVSEGGSVCSRIESMVPGYLTSGSGRTVQLTPVWRIFTDTGVYYVDAVTGAVTPES